MKKITPLKTLKFILCLVTVIILIDLSYSIYIRIHLDVFEKNVKRDTSGYLIGSEPFKAGNGEKAILFVHGFNDSPAIWETWVPFFATNGFYCEAIRLPNSSLGLKEKRDVTITNRMEYIKSKFDNLKQTHSNVILCCHSMGGAYGAAMVASDLVNPDVLVLVAPMFNISQKKSPILTPESWLKIGSKITIFTDSVNNIMPMNIMDKSVVPDYPVHPFIPISLYDTLFELVDICSTNASAINIPVVVMVAENDTVIDTEAAMEYFEDVASTNKVMIIDEASGHVIPRDFDNQIQAELLLKNINKFLKTN